ncbi:hypothetical protein ACFFMN_40450 [Planobispora siamensis]|nr:hypothetical protein [Planobispora siamensis]
MTKKKTAVSLDAWVLEDARQVADELDIPLSTLVQRGLMREIAAWREARASMTRPPHPAAAEALDLAAATADQAISELQADVSSGTRGAAA